MTNTTSPLANSIAKAEQVLRDRMVRNQPVSTKTIAAWLDDANIVPTDARRWFHMAMTTALANLVADGTIRKDNRKYAPGVTTGYTLN